MGRKGIYCLSLIDADSRPTLTDCREANTKTKAIALRSHSWALAFSQPAPVSYTQHRPAPSPAIAPHLTRRRHLAGPAPRRTAQPLRACSVGRWSRQAAWRKRWGGSWAPRCSALPGTRGAVVSTRARAMRRTAAGCMWRATLSRRWGGGGFEGGVRVASLWFGAGFCEGGRSLEAGWAGLSRAEPLCEGGGEVGRLASDGSG